MVYYIYNSITKPEGCQEGGGIFVKNSKNKLCVGIILAALLAVMLSCFVSCGSADGDRGGGDEFSSVTFSDALGRNVTVKKKPERVAALIGSFAEVWQLSGGELCAAAEDAWEDFGLYMGDAVNLGGAHSPSAELLLASRPSFVLASASTASNVELCSLLESAGITVAYFDIDNFEDYLSMLRICTLITEREELYVKNGLELKAQIAEIKRNYAESEISDAEKRVLLLRASSGLVKAKGSEGTILGEMLFDMGCDNIADGETGLLEELSVESIIAAEPYHIFVVTMGDDTEGVRAAVEEMMKEGAWASLGAVREGRVHFMDKRLYNMKPNVRFAEAYEGLYEILTK